MASSSPPKDQDIFGKELGLTSAERNVLSGAGEIFLRKVLQVDTYSKKGDPTEPKTLVVSNSRCFIISHRPTVKLEISFNFLKIQLLECTETKLKFDLPGEKPREFHSSRRDSVEVIGLITAQLKNVFPITPLEMVLKLTFDPDSLRSEVVNLRDSLLSAMDRGDASSLQGFVTSYGFLCDFFGVPFSNEVSWYLKNVYLAHGFRDLNLSDFNHLSPRDLLPVLSTLRHNAFFEGFIIKDDKLTPELVEELCYVMNVSRAIKKLVLKNSSIKPENVIRLSLALKNNPRSVLVHLDLSDNILDDKSIEALGTALENLQHGLQHLVLANCKVTNKAGSLLAQSMKQNKHMQYSLVHFDLSGNPLGPDPLGALTFIQDPHTISYLNLSGCNLTLESVVQVLIRGCQQHLTNLDLSHNAGKGKKGVLTTNVAAKLQQFFSSCISISTINFTECRLTNEIVSAILEGLSVNPNVTSIDLNVSSNDLGSGGDPQSMAKVISRVQCLYRLNLSECGLDHCLPVIVDAIAANTKLKHVSLGKNFSGKQPVRLSAMQRLCALLRKDECHLLSLCLQDTKLKDLTFDVLRAIADNTSLHRLNISGNQMGNHGARYLAKALLTNYQLREVHWDHNDTTLCGLQEVASALEHNYTLRVMPLPLTDIGRLGKGTDGVVQQIQLYLSRNHSDERLKVELAARHRARLLTATQQSSVVSRELVQLEDLLQWAESVYGTSQEDVADATQVKNQANKVLKLTDGLYSPQVESEQFEAIKTQVKGVLDTFMDKVYDEHIKDTSNRMVAQTLKACPTLLTEEAQQTLQGMVLSSGVTSDFTYAKKAVTRKAAPEIVSHVSAINLDVAANISELIVDQTLTKLDKANLRLTKLHKAARVNSTTPDTKVSRNFTFRVEQSTPPKTKKKRIRRPDIDEDDGDEVDLPVQPLETEGPPLAHLGKSRPKPARMQGRRPRPTVKRSSIPDEIPATKVEEEPPKDPDVAVDTEKVESPPVVKKPLIPPPAARQPSPTFEPTVSKSPKLEKTPTPSPTDITSDEAHAETSRTETTGDKSDADETSLSRSTPTDTEPPPSQTVSEISGKSETPKASPKPTPRTRPSVSKPATSGAKAHPSPKARAARVGHKPDIEDKQQLPSLDTTQSSLSTDVKVTPTLDEVDASPESSRSQEEDKSQISADEDNPQSPPIQDEPDLPQIESPPLEEKLESPPLEDKPESPPVKDKPHPPSVEDKPGSPPIDDKPHPPPVEDKPETPPLEDKPETPPIMDKPHPPPVEDKPHPSPVEDKPHPPPVEDKPESPPAEDKPHPPPVEDKPQSPPMEEKPRPPHVSNKPRPSVDVTVNESTTLSTSEDDHKTVKQPSSGTQSVTTSNEETGSSVEESVPVVVVPAVTPREDRPVTPREDRPVTPRENRPVTPREDRPVTPRENRPVTPREDRPVTPSKPGKSGDKTPDRQSTKEKKDTKERKRTGLSKIFGRKQKEDDKPEPVKTEKVVGNLDSRQSGDWEVLGAEVHHDIKPEEATPHKEPPPVIKEKPKRPQPAEQGQAEEPPSKKLPGGVQMPSVNLEELTSALKKKPKVPPPVTEKRSERPSNSSPNMARRASAEPKSQEANEKKPGPPGPPAPKPRPKPRTANYKKAHSSGDVLHTGKQEPGGSEADTCDTLV